MNEKQRRFYFTGLWPRACAAQGWDELPPAERETKRKQVTREALGRDSTTGLSQKQITRLFRYLEWLAQPDNVDAARRVANPREEAGADLCRQLIWKIRRCARRGDFTLKNSYIQKIAEWDCREAQVHDWINLPEAGLRRVLAHVNQRANDKDPEVHQRGPNAAKPAATDTVNYVLRPAPQPAKAECPF